VRNNEKFIVSLLFYRSICSRSIVFVVQTKGPEEWIASPEYTTNSTDTTEQTRLGKLRTKSLRTIQPDFFILNKNRRVLGTQSS
jgi:hypothetical protein